MSNGQKRSVSLVGEPRADSSLHNSMNEKSFFCTPLRYCNRKLASRAAPSRCKRHTVARRQLESVDCCRNLIWGTTSSGQYRARQLCPHCQLRSTKTAANAIFRQKLPDWQKVASQRCRGDKLDFSQIGFFPLALQKQR